MLKYVPLTAALAILHCGGADDSDFEDASNADADATAADSTSTTDAPGIQCGAVVCEAGQVCAYPFGCGQTLVCATKPTDGCFSEQTYCTCDGGTVLVECAGEFPYAPVPVSGLEGVEGCDGGGD